jgi:hypothetical protein
MAAARAFLHDPSTGGTPPGRQRRAARAHLGGLLALIQEAVALAEDLTVTLDPEEDAQT